MLDASRLRFVDHRALVRLAGYARQREAVLVLRAAGTGVARLAALLELPDLRVEVIR
ncbi:hypothetical protein [Micromonospora endophytica]|uniref:hypothetical protein n=1 Tax=Micromonospora endophytica TaxID=515350 RepID=UPI0015E8E48C|nr:hypothetical protein [Micromonospora endophytica]BCJ58850.1 hypothetical protein Jiend_22720 [Micromonospora endophytica]